MAVYDINGNVICGKVQPTYSDAQCTTAFLAYMASKAGLFGMTGTHYENPSGLTYDSYSTPQDELKLCVAVAADRIACDIWSTPSKSFSISGDHARTISVTNNVVGTYDTTLSSGGYKFLGGKGGSLSSSGYERAAVLHVDVSGKTCAVALMAAGQTPYNNIDKSAKELCAMLASKIAGQTPSAGTNLTALVNGGGGYAGCVMPDIPGAYINLEAPAQLILRSDAVSGSPTASRKPASTTKTMTMLCALDYIADEYESVVVKTVDISSGSGSTFYDGDILTYYDALRIMMMESSNTLANTICRAIGERILLSDSIT